MGSAGLCEGAGSADADGLPSCREQTASTQVICSAAATDVQFVGHRIGSAGLREAAGSIELVPIPSVRVEIMPLPLRLYVPLLPELYPRYKLEDTELVPPD